jgi:hypothetical protein
VLHAVHRSHQQALVPDVVAAHEPQVATALHGRLLQEEEIRIGHVGRGEQDGSVGRHVLEPSVAHLDGQAPEREAAE